MKNILSNFISFKELKQVFSLLLYIKKPRLYKAGFK